MTGGFYVENGDYVDQCIKDSYSKINMDLIQYKNQLESKILNSNKKYIEDINKRIQIVEDNYKKNIDILIKWIKLPWYKKLYYKLFKKEKLWNMILS